MVDNNIKDKIIERLTTNKDEKVLCMVIGKDESVTPYIDCTLADAKKVLQHMIKDDFYAPRLILSACIDIIEDGLMREATK